MYERLGFKEVGGFGMEIPGPGEDGGEVVYREVCRVWEPGAAAAAVVVVDGST